MRIAKRKLTASTISFDFYVNGKMTGNVYLEGYEAERFEGRLKAAGYEVLDLIGTEENDTLTEPV